MPTNIQYWQNIAFLHWPFPPGAIAPLVADGLEVLTFDGSAWVTVTPFVIRVHPPGLPSAADRWTFPETNVRTYVRTADGREGVWFLHMEVDAIWFMAALRTIGLPYVRQHMSVEPTPGQTAYRSRGRQGGHHIVVRPDAALDPPEGSPRDRFLTARWGAFHRRGPILLYTPVAHPPWPLHGAIVQSCEVGGLFARAGLPAPTSPPLAHWSSGVAVRVGLPRIVGMGAGDIPGRQVNGLPGRRRPVARRSR